MNHKIYIGIDNGVTGTIGWVGDDIAPGFIETPVFSEQSYTKEKKNISRIDHIALRGQLQRIISVSDPNDLMVVIERPMVNPMRFAASCSALRALEATLIVIEDLKLPHIYIDSRQWQKALLPHGCKGAELKDASADIGVRLFPTLSGIITKHKDADALLIAEWARRSNL